MQKSKWKKAASCYEKAEKLGFKTYWVNVELGAVYSKIGREGEAITRLGKALLVRTNARIYLYLADAHINLAKKRGLFAFNEKRTKTVNLENIKIRFNTKS